MSHNKPHNSVTARHLVILAEAKREWLDAMEYYEIQKRGLGEKFSIQVEKKLAEILENPKHFEKKKHHYREANLKPFPFLIIFRIDKENSAVVIVGIFHAKRNPRKKHNREKIIN